MRILLVGDYSGVHSSLRDALLQLGYDVLLVSTGDGYKKYHADIFIEEQSILNNYFSKTLRLIFEFLGLKGLLLYLTKYRSTFSNFKNYDVVQLMNPIPFDTFGSIASFFILKKLLKQNKKLFLCALGDDYIWVRYCLDKKFSYSIFDRFGYKTFTKFIYSLKYVYGFFFKQLNLWAIKNSALVITSLSDYYIPYKQAGIKLVKLPLPISENKRVLSITPTGERVKIFHGWQEGKETRKGNDVMHKAVEKLVEKYGESRVDYKIVKSVSFDEYVKLFNDADIFLDQTYSQDCGVNALLGMSAGKVVFSGFEESPCLFKDKQPNIKQWGVNATASVEDNFNSLSYLIENTSVIDDIKKSALKKSEESASLNVAKAYVATWSSVV